jgi:two-component system KDP operon response regulator KdpE
MRDTALRPLAVLIVTAGSAEACRNAVCRGGHTAAVATSGKAALEAASANPPDVVVIDLQLPDMDGSEVSRLFREQTKSHPKRPFLVVRTDSAVAVQSGGADLHLTKGDGPGVLVGVLRRFQMVLAEPTRENRHLNGPLVQPR